MNFHSKKKLLATLLRLLPRATLKEVAHILNNPKITGVIEDENTSSINKLKFYGEDGQIVSPVEKEDSEAENGSL